jgi:hypothetical protein
LIVWKQEKFTCLLFILQQFLFAAQVIVQYLSFDNFILPKHNLFAGIIPFFLELEIRFISYKRKLQISSFLDDGLELSEDLLYLFHSKLNLIGLPDILMEHVAAI